MNSKQTKHLTRTMSAGFTFLLIGITVFALAIFQGCASIKTTSKPVVSPAVEVVIEKENYAAEPHYVSPTALLQFSALGLKISGLGAESIIMDVQEKVRNIRSLYGSQAVSFATDKMPEDMERLLKKYKTDDTYEDYYNYVMATTQRAILCPQINLTYYKPGHTINGFILNEADLIYPEENTVYINTLYNRQDSDPIIRLVSSIVHETSHILLKKLVRIGKLPYFYLMFPMYDERYANIRQVDFLKAVAQDLEFNNIHGRLMVLINDREKKIEAYNAQLGLAAGDRTLLPLAEKNEDKGVLK